MSYTGSIDMIPRREDNTDCLDKCPRVDCLFKGDRHDLEDHSAFVCTMKAMVADAVIHGMDENSRISYSQLAMRYTMVIDTDGRTLLSERKQGF